MKKELTFALEFAIIFIEGIITKSLRWSGGSVAIESWVPETFFPCKLWWGIESLHTEWRRWFIVISGEYDITCNEVPADLPVGGTEGEEPEWPERQSTRKEMR
ncbi:hypothetical protein [Victivallis sp. Marseille-Q1083]|uniref:hypothetical protein n=1 Tax=Victivallis sp. Marseille-Q1083 TaxID=2717288 RepID=UPI00158ECDEA|nr:hypothetical protein [Victivallis sp. Marseille-Q1083]